MTTIYMGLGSHIGIMEETCQSLVNLSKFGLLAGLLERPYYGHEIKWKDKRNQSILYVRETNRRSDYFLEGCSISNTGFHFLSCYMPETKSNALEVPVPRHKPSSRWLDTTVDTAGSVATVSYLMSRAICRVRAVLNAQVWDGDQYVLWEKSYRRFFTHFECRLNEDHKHLTERPKIYNHTLKNC
ncbi:uncharacterized protein BDR25DRAFT_360166 [Lindgomyces ingoldianus]|uniref:Uncharacterized protein n=1 Tax=Lindgomyces ingoldianus TaxID=673940 RepID=A0ACB6QGH0_9PLEO|nr:uncharacterized protein BDR25DRAFT_360166 [Lindgomyces ingoldianus]KAF2466021.1 hypothetical protein BDR25DRAFT_360166 [Lindgomyces ingoldianus]